MSEYESSKYGYVPHDRQIKAVCPHCGKDQFHSYPQSISLDAEKWCHEYHCHHCGYILGVEVIR